MGGGIPRFVTLEVYVPKVNQNLPDWEVAEGEEMEQVKSVGGRGAGTCIGSSNMFALYTLTLWSWYRIIKHVCSLCSNTVELV